MGQEHVSKRTYIVASRAWYAETTLRARDVTEQISVSYRKGKHSWEIIIRLYSLTPSRSAFCIEMFEDTWAAFADVPDLFRALADRGEDVDVGEIEATLTELGFKDATPETNPEDSPPLPMHHCSRCGLTEPVRG